MRKLSLIIPVLNEAQIIAGQLAALRIYRSQGHEVIVVDGGSGDNTIALAEEHADRVLLSQSGRARQMNRGAAEARGDVLVFLHVDTRLPDHGDALIAQALAGNTAQWGWFNARLSHPGLLYRLISGTMNLRARLTRICTGDQALFVERDLFERLQGFPDIPLMEDVAFSKTLRKQAPAAMVRTPVTTSSRRWEQYGVLATVLLMWKLRFLYFCGVRPEKLLRRYYPGPQA